MNSVAYSFSVYILQVGIELACSDPPELILMDIDLPGICGFQAQQMLANNPDSSLISRKEHRELARFPVTFQTFDLPDWLECCLRKTSFWAS